MNRILIGFLLLLNFSVLFGKELKLEKVRQKYDGYASVSYTTTAYYPNPETEDTTRLDVFYIVNNFKTKDFEFYSKAGALEEFYRNGDYSYVDHDGKSIYKYEDKQNETEAVGHSRLVQYGPTFLLRHDWNYQGEVVVNGAKEAHFSFVESVREYEGKKIKVEFHIYVSKDYTVSRFERKSFVDTKLGQTVTFEFKDYTFSKKEIVFKKALPENYALRYYERDEISPLEKGTKAPDFSVRDIDNVGISSDNFAGQNTLLLFSSTNCGASKEVSDYVNGASFSLPTDFKLINAYGSDKKEKVEQYLKNKTNTFSIIVDQKEIETKYQISGYPVLYLVDGNGVIVGVYDGFDQIIAFLRDGKKIAIHEQNKNL